MQPGPAGRWERLFADLEAQAVALDEAAEREESAQAQRLLLGAVSLRERLRGADGGPLVLGLTGHLPLRLQLREVGPDWLLGLAGAAGGELLVPIAALAWVEGLSRSAVGDPAGRVWAGLDFRRAVRGLATERAAIAVGLVGGDVLTGTPDRVYADHLDLALHPVGEPRRATSVTGVRALPLGAVGYLRRLA